MFEPVIAEEPGFAEFPHRCPLRLRLLPRLGVYHYNGLKVLEKGGALDGVRTLLVVVPQKRFAVAILANRNLTALPEAVRAALLQQAFGRPGEADLQPAIRAKAQDIERLLLAAEPRPADAKPPARPWRPTPAPTATTCGAPGPWPNATAPLKCRRDRPATAPR